MLALADTATDAAVPAVDTAFVKSDVETCVQDSHPHGKQDLLLSNRLSQLVLYQLFLSQR